MMSFEIKSKVLEGPIWDRFFHPHLHKMGCSMVVPPPPPPMNQPTGEVHDRIL